MFAVLGNAPGTGGLVVRRLLRGRCRPLRRGRRLLRGRCRLRFRRQRDVDPVVRRPSRTHGREPDAAVAEHAVRVSVIARGRHRHDGVRHGVCEVVVRVGVVTTRRVVRDDVVRMRAQQHRVRELRRLPTRRRLPREVDVTQRRTGRGPQRSRVQPEIRRALVEPDPGRVEVALRRKTHAELDAARVGRRRNSRLRGRCEDRHGRRRRAGMSHGREDAAEHQRTGNCRDPETASATWTSRNERMHRVAPQHFTAPGDRPV